MVLEIFNDQRDKCGVYWTQLPNVYGLMYYLFAGHLGCRRELKYELIFLDSLDFFCHILQ